MCSSEKGHEDPKCLGSEILEGVLFEHWFCKACNTAWIVEG